MTEALARELSEGGSTSAINFGSSTGGDEEPKVCWDQICLQIKTMQPSCFLLPTSPCLPTRSPFTSQSVRALHGMGGRHRKLEPKVVPGGFHVAPSALIH